MNIHQQAAAITRPLVPLRTSDDGGLSDNGIRLLIDEAKKQARVEREISPSEVADLSILREAQKELGIKTK